MVNVQMYTLSTCPVCRKTKKFFLEKGIQFDFVDYDLAGEEEQNRIAAEMLKRTGHVAFPFVKIGDAVVVGFNPERYEHLIRSGKLEAAVK